MPATSSHRTPTVMDDLPLLARPVAMEIIALLTEGERDVTSLATALELDISTISRALRRLRELEWVERRIDRRRRVYRLAPPVHRRAERSGVTIGVTRPDGSALALFVPWTTISENFAGLSKCPTVPSVTPDDGRARNARPREGEVEVVLDIVRRAIVSGEDQG